MIGKTMRLKVQCYITISVSKSEILCLTISALDPAGPLFEDYEIDVRIDATDANYVDVIHTDGDNFGKYVLYKNESSSSRSCEMFHVL